ncbi:CLUMA_CG014650, isoform A [Clunio marinus]|uniref:CLUMA_CG014650, isoform A n=1 Tax=Clunio marinus TaxID=568069 RepID=A0A1J1IMC1_9DIPT|nr:CLUMA_CG014650, isoform A [Clunio marinus]
MIQLKTDTECPETTSFYTLKSLENFLDCLLGTFTKQIQSSIARFIAKSQGQSDSFKEINFEM